MIHTILQDSLGILYQVMYTEGTLDYHSQITLNSITSNQCCTDTATLK